MCKSHKFMVSNIVLMQMFPLDFLQLLWLCWLTDISNRSNSSASFIAMHSILQYSRLQRSITQYFHSYCVDFLMVLLKVLLPIFHYCKIWSVLSVCCGVLLYGYNTWLFVQLVKVTETWSEEKTDRHMEREREPQLSINQICKYGMRMVNHSMRTAVDIG